MSYEIIGHDNFLKYMEELSKIGKKRYEEIFYLDFLNLTGTDKDSLCYMTNEKYNEYIKNIEYIYSDLHKYVKNMNAIIDDFDLDEVSKSKEEIKEKFIKVENYLLNLKLNKDLEVNKESGKFKI